MRPDTREFAWTPLDEVGRSTWLSEGPTPFAHVDDGLAWRYGEAGAFAVSPTQGARLIAFSASPQQRYLLHAEAMLDETIDQGIIRVLDGFDFAELGRWTGCLHEHELVVWIDDGPGLLIAETNCEPTDDEPFWLMRVAEGPTQVLVELAEDPLAAIPSPDGRWLAIVLEDHGTLFDLRTGAVALEQDAPGFSRFVWRPDSTLFAYRGDDETVVRDLSMAELARFPSVGGQPQFTVDGRVGTVHDNAVVVYDPWTDERRSFAAPVPMQIARWFLGDPRIHVEPPFNHPRRMAYVLDPDAGSWVELVSLGRFAFAPSWSPDGSSLLAFEACDEETRRPILFDEDLGRRVGGPCRDYWSSVWSPDSDVVALELRGHDEVLLMRADGEIRSLGQGDVIGWRP